MATDLISLTRITTSTTLLRSTESTGSSDRATASSPREQENSFNAPKDILQVRSSSETQRSQDRLASAAREYLDTLNKLGRAFGFRSDDPIAEFARAVVRGGSEDDEISAIGRTRINGGGGDDEITAIGRSRIRGGSGDDIINTLGRSRVNGGSGDDVITAVGRSRIQAGSGDDIVNVIGRSSVRAGSGDDILNAFGQSRIQAGSGDDVINAYGRSRISGGAGDDVILVGGEGAVINFGEGDGSDTIYAETDVQINIGSGLTEDSLNIAYEAGKATITFEGSDQELTLFFGEDSQVQLNFGNGDSLDLVPNIDVSA